MTIDSKHTDQAPDTTWTHWAFVKSRSSPNVLGSTGDVGLHYYQREKNVLALAFVFVFPLTSLLQNHVTTHVAGQLVLAVSDFLCFCRFHECECESVCSCISSFGWYDKKMFNGG
jgi:hypothetical protein